MEFTKKHNKKNEKERFLILLSFQILGVIKLEEECINFFFLAVLFYCMSYIHQIEYCILLMRSEPNNMSA